MADHAFPMKKMEPDKLPVQDDLSAPEVLVDGFSGASLSNGILRINLHVDRFHFATGQTTHFVVQRLAMPLPVAIAMTEGLEKILDQMTTDGIIPPRNRPTQP